MRGARQEPPHRHRATQLLQDLATQRGLLGFPGLDLAARKLPLAPALGVTVPPGHQDATVPADDRRDHPHLLHRMSTAISSPALESR